MGKIRFAVVSTDGIHVNGHFGKAKEFLIYDANEKMVLVGKRGIEPLSVKDPGHPFDLDKFQQISNKLNDCSKVFMEKIGETPAAKLKEMGIEPVTYNGPIAGITV